MSLSSGRSANSGDKSSSKRSRNSSTTSNGKKKRPPNQKTLGMAWGSNSLSSSRSSFRSSPFSDFGSYMVDKNRKLLDQFDADAATSSHSNTSLETPIFHRVSIFVDGFTIPSSQELRDYMLKHGGRYVNYFSRHQVTHIICSNLPASKIQNIRSFSCGLPVVKPKWIVDSVAAKKLLSWVPYQLDQLADNQPRLSVFFAKKSGVVVDDVLATTAKPPKECAGLLEVDKKSEGRGQDSEESDDGNEDGTVTNASVSETRNVSECVRAESTDADSDEGNTKENVIYSHSEPSTSGSNYDSLGSSAITCSSKRHSTLDDPNFVENYFKSSRLHFIGTWRNRYRKRFPGVSNGFKGPGFTPKTSHVSEKTSIIHVDMDCFFVSVVIRKLPELQDKPVAICHSDNPKGTAEISSANYPARAYGIKAGIFVRSAKMLCPHLVILPYNFEAYEEVADRFYDILHKHCNKVQAISCDEAFIDVTDSQVEDPELLASLIRKEIFETTGCTASAGIAGNMLMARLATRTAKPNGQCCIPLEKVDEYLQQLPINALPGIGYVLEEKLKKRNLFTCGQLRTISKGSLQRDYGDKTGEMLWNYCRGIDNRMVGTTQESKSIGAEVNWGVRFKDSNDSKLFLANLCKEVSLRLQGCGVQGRKFTLKIKKRRQDAEEPAKYMGCGDCENLSHSVTIPVATDDLDVLQRIATQLFGSFHIDVKEIRGVGLQVSSLENADAAKVGLDKNLLKSWLNSGTAKQKEGTLSLDAKEEADSVGRSSDREVHSIDLATPPPLCDLDLGIITSLPSELFSELNDAYGGKLVSLISKGKGKSEDRSNFDEAFNSFGRSFPERCKAAGEGAECSTSLNKKSPVYHQALQDGETIAAAVSESKIKTSMPAFNKTDLVPSSLSQVDPSVLQQLPEELKDGILQLFPAHRAQDTDLKTSDIQEPLMGSRSEGNLQTGAVVMELWKGNPPLWVDKYKVSNCLILNILAEMYEQNRSTGKLSSVLQCCISKVPYLLDANYGCSEETICSLCELVKQYIKLRISVDIEEIYVSFQLLRRLAAKSKMFLKVYDTLLPHLQASVNEKYGGAFAFCGANG